MAIYIIGLLANGSEKLVRLYNDRKNQYRDMKEKDVLFMLDEETISIKNATIKDNKLTGSTGSLEKIKNKTVYIALGYISDTEGKPVAYKFVDSNGKVYVVEVHDCIGFFEKNVIQNASLVDNKFIRGINWEIPCVEKRKKTPKNVMIRRLGENITITPKKEDMVLYWHFKDDDAFLTCMGGKVKSSWGSFGLLVHSDNYDNLLEILADKVNTICVNSENEEYRYVEFDNLHESFSKDVEYVKELSKKLGLELSIFVNNEVKLRYTSFSNGSNDIKVLMSRWGFTLVNDNGTLSWKGKQNYPFDRDNLSVWNDYLGYLYQKYLKKVQSHYGIPVVLKKKYSNKGIESPTNLELTIKVLDNGVVFQPKPSSTEPTGVKVRKDSMFLNMLPSKFDVELSREGPIVDIFVDLKNILYVDAGIYDEVLLTLIKNSKSEYFQRISFDNSNGFGIIECSSLFYKISELFNLFEGKKRYVDYTKVINPLKTYLESKPISTPDSIDNISRDLYDTVYNHVCDDIDEDYEDYKDEVGGSYEDFRDDVILGFIKHNMIYDDNLLYTLNLVCDNSIMKFVDIGSDSVLFVGEGEDINYTKGFVEGIETEKDYKLFKKITNNCDLNLFYYMGYILYNKISDMLSHCFSKDVKIKKCDIGDLSLEKIRKEYNNESKLYKNLRLDEKYFKSHDLEFELLDFSLWYMISLKRNN